MFHPFNVIGVAYPRRLATWLWSSIRHLRPLATSFSCPSRNRNPSLLTTIVILLVTATLLARGADNPLTLREALSRALRLSPELATFPYDERAAEARVVQAGLRPNPEVSLEVEDFGGNKEFSGFGESETTLKLSQLLELGGKRAARIQEAKAGKALVKFDYDVKRLEVLSQTAQAFYEVLGAQRRVELNEELARLAQESVPAIQERVKSGRASAVEQSRNDVAVASARIALEQAKGDLSAARRNLAAKWGAREPAFGSAVGDLERVAKPPPFRDYVRLLSAYPSVARWLAETNKRRATVEKEKAQGAPDVTLTVGPRWWEGPEAAAIFASISVPLPLQNRNQGAIREAQAMVEKAASERKAAEVVLEEEAGEAYAKLVRAYTEIQILNSSVLPDARRTMNAVNEGYAIGRFSQLDVLEARRTITEARTRYLQVLVEYHKASAQLDALTGATPTASRK